MVNFMGLYTYKSCNDKRICVKICINYHCSTGGCKDLWFRYRDLTNINYYCSVN